MSEPTRLPAILDPLLDALNALSWIPADHENQWEQAVYKVLAEFGQLPDALVGPKRNNHPAVDPDAEVRATLVRNAICYARDMEWQRAFSDLCTAVGMLSDAQGQPVADALAELQARSGEMTYFWQPADFEVLRDAVATRGSESDHRVVTAALNFVNRSLPVTKRLP